MEAQQQGRHSPITLVRKDLADVPGKELSMITVEYAPGASDPVHTHHAQALVYVLEGSIVMQVKGAAPVTLRPGQTFYEGPDDVHVVGRNASDTAPAKFLVVPGEGQRRTDSDARQVTGGLRARQH